MYGKVLLAYDGSQSGRTALLECADINNLLHAEIHLLAVAPLMAGLYLTEGFVPESLQDEENRRFKDILDEVRSSLEQIPGDGKPSDPQSDKADHVRHAAALLEVNPAGLLAVRRTA